MKSPKTKCHCESGKLYESCCKPYHEGEVVPSAETLMRSRYTAYVLELEDYLMQTWHKNTRPDALNLREEPRSKWLGLQIKRTETIGTDKAIVEFVARYKTHGKAERLHEISQFIKINSRWYYVDGEHVH